MSRTNLAYDFKNYDYNYRTLQTESFSSNIRIKKTETAASAAPVQSKKAKKSDKAFSVLLSCLVVLAFFVLCRGVIITEKYDKLETKRQELKQMQTTNQKTQIEIDSALNLKNVEDIAQNRLDMARPEKSQTVYIKIQQDDFVEKTNSQGATKVVGEFFGNLKAYLD